MKTRPKQRKSASNQSSIVQGFFKAEPHSPTRQPTFNDIRQKNIQDILNKIKNK